MLSLVWKSIRSLLVRKSVKKHSFFASYLHFKWYQWICVPLLHRIVFTKKLINCVHNLNKNETTFHTAANNGDLIVWEFSTILWEKKTVLVLPKQYMWSFSPEENTFLIKHHSLYLILQMLFLDISCKTKIVLYSY